MSGQLTEAEKAEVTKCWSCTRSVRQNEISLLGKTLEVLLEEEVEIDGKAYYLGHSREYVKVAVPKTEKYGVNDILAVKVEKKWKEKGSCSHCSYSEQGKPRRNHSMFCYWVRDQ